MSRLRVWAPRAREVAMISGERSVPLESEAGGWWRSTAVLEHGEDYGLALDGGRPLPDPRSAWQPAGVHGLSRWLDHSRFDWTDQGWRAPELESAVFYELHVGTFTPEGTFQGVINRLPYLRELGISHVELMPVNQFPGRRGWGYDGVDLYAAHEAYGGPLGLKRLVDAAHGQGLAMVLDVVYNHLGPDGNYLGRFGPYLTERYSTPWGGAINLDGPGSHEVRRFLIDNALMWLRDYHFDALRLDAVHAFVDLSAMHFLEELSAEVDQLAAALGRPLKLIAESDLNDPRVVRPRTEHGHGIHGQWSDELHHAIHVTLTGERDGYYADFSGFADLCRALANVFVYDGRYSPARDRRHGRAVGDMPRQRFLGYSQNHDQVGNRAAGERLSQLLEHDALKVAAALVLLGPHVPLLFQGEEWAAGTPFQYFTDHQDEVLAGAVSQGRRHEFEAFGWDPSAVPDPQARETFEHSRLDWTEQQHEDHAAMLGWYRELIHARRSIPALAAGPVPRVTCDEDEQWLLVQRSGTFLAVNLGQQARRLELPVGDWQLRLKSHAEVSWQDHVLSLPAPSAALLLAADEHAHAGRRPGAGPAGAPR